jgi:hypothetical protein
MAQLSAKKPRHNCNGAHSVSKASESACKLQGEKTMKNIKVIKSLLTLTAAATLSIVANGFAAPIMDVDGSYHSGDTVLSLQTGSESIDGIYVQAFHLGQLAENPFFFDQSTTVSGLKITSVKAADGLKVTLDSATLMRPENGSAPLLRINFDLTDGNNVTATYPVEVTVQNTNDGTSSTFDFMVNVTAPNSVSSNE